ncbi:hypothetical protein PoB_004159600 [Plakobranchus ocellatus]|uniref:CCHC-type domain-containing protein n=1 Tax=Plakobranchus ocellatus TaxID=259542 RepID=A0AAV4B8E9_9GAST|nr:hypothetical protein PoB_004159600 [Plakobranchus ocellatus]
MNLGANASLATIMAKFKSVHGPILSLNTVMATIYSMKQAETEDAGSFVQRLEDTAHQAVTLGRVEQKELNALLKEAFCAGLKPQTKLATGFLLENKALTFDQLSLKVKRREKELKVATTAQVHAAQTTEIAELRSQEAQLTAEIRALKQTSSHSLAATHYNHVNSFTSATSARNLFVPRASVPTSARPNLTWTEPNRSRSPTTCFRCGQPGYIARGYRNQPMRSKPLNSNRPVEEGNPQAATRPALSGHRR